MNPTGKSRKLQRESFELPAWFVRAVMARAERGNKPSKHQGKQHGRPVGTPKTKLATGSGSLSAITALRSMPLNNANDGAAYKAAFEKEFPGIIAKGNSIASWVPVYLRRKLVTAVDTINEGCEHFWDIKGCEICTPPVMAIIPDEIDSTLTPSAPVRWF